jgi:hypothetical protein
LYRESIVSTVGDFSLKDGGYFSAGMEASWSAHQIEYISGVADVILPVIWLTRLHLLLLLLGEQTNKNRQRKTKRKKKPK